MAVMTLHRTDTRPKARPFGGAVALSVTVHAILLGVAALGNGHHATPRPELVPIAVTLADLPAAKPVIPQVKPRQAPAPAKALAAPQRAVAAKAAPKPVADALAPATPTASASTALPVAVALSSATEAAPASDASAPFSDAIGASGASDAAGEQASSPDLGSLRDRYLATLRARLEAKKRTPRSELEGTVYVRFQVARDGAATDITLFGGSREPDLRAAALASVKAASPFKPLPTELSEEALTVEVPIVFELEDE